MATPTKNFPTSSYRSYTSFLSKYSSSQPNTAPPSKQVVNKEVRMTNGNESSNDRPCNFNSLNSLIDINALLAMTNQEIELIDKKVLKKFLLLLNEDQDKRTDVNNNVERGEVNDRKSAPSDADIENNKQSLIDSLKRQLQRYRYD